MYIHWAREVVIDRANLTILTMPFSIVDRTTDYCSSELTQIEMTTDSSEITDR